MARRCLVVRRRFSTMITSLPGVKLGQMYRSGLRISQLSSAG
ncbi:hypothetical protein HMPREF1162_0443 [ [[Propionibacterium] namnetense SK182B-JCVI]|uniref:Uncharacterized protein n=1 Tax=[Propionibacterium] namnetense SK182B-JCVI TaxID=1051006 RepID=F9NTR8_9ACTN|nr:hypothetical protein HMPREF1162_0443 [ [[Propionibacterium] namnetense SK182B-JCVI]